MKKIDKDPTQKELVDLIVENPIGRNADLVSMAETLLSTEGGMTYFLDGDWGSGKTFFVKQLQIVLEALNPNIDDYNATARVLDVPEIAELQSLVASKDAHDVDDHGESEAPQSPSYLPVYYNAWENDHWDDPLPSIIQTIVWQAGGSGKVDAGDPIEKFGGIVGNILKAANLGFVSETCKTISGESLLQQYEDRLRIRHYIRQLVGKALDGREEKMLLIIDELDRCRPVFALKLLEQVKNIFDSDKLVVLYAVNMKELGKTVEHQYGSGVDGARYLTRFYDNEFTLFPPANRTYLVTCGIPNDSYRTNMIAHEMRVALNMSLRDQNRFVLELKRAESRKNPNAYASIDTSTFVQNALATLLIALRIMRFDDYRKIISLQGDDELFHYANQSDNFLEYLDAVIFNLKHRLIGDYPDSEILFQTANGLSPEEEAERNEVNVQMRRLVLGKIMLVAFSCDDDSDSYREARRLVCNSWPGSGNLNALAQRLLG